MNIHKVNLFLMYKNRLTSSCAGQFKAALILLKKTAKTCYFKLPVSKALCAKKTENINGFNEV